MRTSCSGLPICLSGIQILPQARPPQRTVRPPASFKARSTRDRACSFSDAQNLASDRHTSTDCASVMSVAHASENECTLDAGSRGHVSSLTETAAELPRFAIAKEMADLDRRREAIRKQRNLQNLVYVMEEYRLLREHNEFIRLYFQEHTTLQDQSECLLKNRCAKAA